MDGSHRLRAAGGSPRETARQSFSCCRERWSAAKPRGHGHDPFQRYRRRIVVERRGRVNCGVFTNQAACTWKAEKKRLSCGK